MLFLRWLITFYHSKYRTFLLRRQLAKLGNKLRKLRILALGLRIGGAFFFFSVPIKEIFDRYAEKVSNTL